jgi:hypothetical protein
VNASREDDDPLAACEEAVFCIGSLPCRSEDTDAISKRLDALPGWTRRHRELLRWRWRPDGDPHPSYDVLEDLAADVALEGDQVVIETDSTARMERTLAVLEPALEGLVGEPFVSIAEVVSPVTDPSGAILPDAHTVLVSIKDECYRCMLDEKLPQFGQQSARQRVKTAAGRAQVIAWLEALEEMESVESSATGIPRYDIRWLWRELGIDARH